MKPIVLKSMELSDDEKLDSVMPIPTDRPDFPYGLRLCLCGEELEKLELDPAYAVVGGMIHGHFMARITSVSISDGEMSSGCRLELQIESLAIESEDEEDDEPEVAPAPKRKGLYRG